MKKNWYKLLNASHPAPKASEPLVEGRGLPAFGYGDFSGAYYGATTLLNNSIAAITSGITADIIEAPVPKLPEDIIVPELDAMGLNATPEDHDGQATLGSQFLSMVTDAWVTRAMRDFLVMINGGMPVPAINDAIEVLNAKLTRFLVVKGADGSMATADLSQEILELFRQSQMETILLSHDTLQLMGPIVLDIENAALCVRIHQDYSFKLYPLAIDHQVLRAVIYAASEPNWGRNNIFVGLQNLANAIPNPIFEWLSQPLRANETDASIAGYKHDPMSASNYNANYSQNPDSFHALTVTGYGSGARLNPTPDGMGKTPGFDFLRQVDFNADADLPMMSRTASGPDDTTSLPILNAELSFTNFCRVNENMGRDLGVLAALLDLVTMDPAVALRAQTMMLNRLHDLKDWMLKARTGKLSTTQDTNWTGAPTLMNPMLVISNPEVLSSNQWDITTAKDGETSKRYREASEKLATYLDAIKGKQADLNGLVERYKRVKAMVDFVVAPMFANPLSAYGLARFDLLSAEAKTLLEGVFDFIGAFYVDLSVAIGQALPREVLDADIVPGLGPTVDHMLDRAKGAKSMPRAMLINKLAALRVMGEGVFLPNMQAFLASLDRAFGQTVASGNDLMKKDFLAQLGEPVFFKFPVGGASISGALLGRMLASDQTMLATPEDKDAFLSDVRADGAAFARAMETTMAAQNRVVNLAGFEAYDTETGRMVVAPVAEPSEMTVALSPGDMLSQLVAKPSRVLQVSAVIINKARSLYHSLAALR